MSIDLCILASGSMGNCAALRTPSGILLIDIGIGPRTVAGRLRLTGIPSHDIAAICLTHLDRDHFNLNWIRTLLDRGVRVFCHANRVDDAIRIAGDLNLRSILEPFGDDPFEPLPGLTFNPIHLPHDDDGSHGFAIEGWGSRIGYATDLGSVPESLLAHFRELDVLAIESNYDPDMQRNSNRPMFLQRRITGGHGHLSNAQSLAAVRQILDRCQRDSSPLPAHIVLLHRSQQCNCPELVRNLFSRDARIAKRLVLSHQDEPTRWMGKVTPFVGRQLTLAW